MSAATAALPEWVTETPFDTEYWLTMTDGSEHVQDVDISRREFLQTKLFVAGLRGYAVPHSNDNEQPVPEWLTYTPKDPQTTDPALVAWYTLNLTGNGDVDALQEIRMDRAEFEFLKRCLAARRKHTPRLVTEEGE